MHTVALVHAQASTRVHGTLRCNRVYKRESLPASASIGTARPTAPQEEGAVEGNAVECAMECTMECTLKPTSTFTLTLTLNVNLTPTLTLALTLTLTRHLAEHPVPAYRRLRPLYPGDA